MKRINLRLWLNASQRRALEMTFYLLILGLACSGGTLFMLFGKDSSVAEFSLAYAVPQADGAIIMSSLRWCLCIQLFGFFLGFCCLGQPLLVLLLAFHGFCTGCRLTELSDTAADASPVLYIISAIYAAAVSFSLLLCVRESVRLACKSMKVCLYGSDSLDMRRRFKLYFVRYIIVFFLIAAETAGYAGLCKIW